MGLIGDVVGWVSEKVSNFFGSSSSSGGGKSSSSNSGGGGSSYSGGGESYSHVYNYEPDKVRIAEIERETKLAMADKEAERIELMRDAQIELLQAQAVTQAAIEKARVEGMKEMAAQFVELQEKMLDVAKKRIDIIEAGSLPIIREIETFYAEVGARITANRDEYNTKKLPQLLEILEQYEEGSTSQKFYMKQIELDQIQQAKFIEHQLEQVAARQNVVLQSFLSTKEKVLEQTAQITQSIASTYLEKFDKALPPLEIKSLPEPQKQLKA